MTNRSHYSFTEWFITGFEEYVAGHNQLVAQNKPTLLQHYHDQIEELWQEFLHNRWQPANIWHWQGIDDAHQLSYQAQHYPMTVAGYKHYILPTDGSLYPEPCDYCGRRMDHYYIMQDVVQDHGFCSYEHGFAHRQELFQTVPQLVALYQLSPYQLPFQPLPLDPLRLQHYLRHLPPIELGHEIDWTQYQPRLKSKVQRMPL